MPGVVPDVPQLHRHRVHRGLREIRYLDKLIDELAKGKPMDKILRTA